MNKNTKTKSKGRDKSKIVVYIIFILGLAIFLYPTIASLINSRGQSVVIDTYQKELDKKSEEQKKKDVEEKLNYSIGKMVGDSNIKDPFAKTEEEKDDTKTDLTLLGYIQIPKIGQKIPIYEGSSDYVLQNGVGHLTGTSMPFGGNGTHCVLTGHRGLPSAKLFTDLPNLTYGDEFYITTEAGTIAYSVDQIITILPSDISNLLVVPNEDYVTLVTCTPYMINSHRLLVRGHRVPYNPETEKQEEYLYWLKLAEKILLIVFAIVVLIIIILIRRRIVSKRKKMNTKKDGSNQIK